MKTRKLGTDFLIKSPAILNMTNKIICVLLSLFLVGCSEKPEVQTLQTTNSSPTEITGLPFQPTVIDSLETKETDGITNQADGIFQSENFDKLDMMAKEFRDSKASYPNGYWKLNFLYEGLHSREGAPESDWTNHFKILADWIKAKPDSITARVALANEWIDYAWEARGHDYADNVSDTGWKLFSQRLNNAVQVLTASKQFDEQCPGWWVALLRIELGLQAERPEYDKTFNAAIRAWPNYAQFYFVRANFLLPRWYGTEGELETDLEKSADKIGGDAGDIVYAQTVWNLHHSISSTNIFQEYNFSWQRTNRGLVALAKSFPDSTMLKNEAAHLAVLAHDPDAAKKYFDQTKGQIDLSAWETADDYIEFAHLVYGSPQ